MLKKKKRLLYREGLYHCRAPMADTAKWSVDDWCHWIDENGTWLGH
jgi:hypothetical protein